ncbi:MAG TPA: nucleoside-diphosphate sugar epimerase/dehydratase [Gemmatimonadales bacterium]|nr:nucleoside-diphosphate sugar epimerase/dehydratase [Gemmatimonadales bacterium]
MLWSTLKPVATVSHWARLALGLAFHAFLVSVGYVAAFVLHFDLTLPASALAQLLATLPVVLLIRLVLAHRFRVTSGYWQHVGFRDLVQLCVAASIGSAAIPLVLLALDQLHGIPPALLVLEWLLAIGLPAAARALARLAREGRSLLATAQAAGRRTLVIGAGAAGEQLLRQILHDPACGLHVVGLVDDDPSKQQRSLHGVHVVGTSSDLRRLAAIHHASLALIAIPSAAPEDLRRVVDRCTAAGLDVKLLPPFKHLVTGDVHVSQVRDVRIDDLLTRDPVVLDLQAVQDDLAGKVVLITGAGGSIGAELARQVATYHPLTLILLERAESALYFIHHEVSQRHPEIQVVPALASVTNSARLSELFEIHRPHCVFHAAAYKHVPLLEWNPVEGVWNNVIGTLRLARCAAQHGTGRFVLISTDKAVHPTSVLGATKLVAERIVLDLPSLRASATDFRVVRFGNVLGSDGSVLPLFQRQLAAGGPLTVTHPEVRRYFMTIPEAVQLVLLATALPEARGGIALLEMGTQVRIVDLAEQLIRLAGLVPHKDVEIVFTGLRPGEKLHEELLATGERAVPTSVDKIRVVERNGTAQADGLAKQLRTLIRLAASQDPADGMRALAALAPGYDPRGFRNGRSHNDASHWRDTVTRLMPSTNGTGARNGTHRRPEHAA